MPAIELKDVWKRFRLRFEKKIFVQEMFARLIPGRDFYSEIWALQGLSLTVEKGEAFGIIGRNSTGKTTVLRLMAGITAPTRGEVRTEGRIAAMLELGAGFQPELTGRENVYLNGMVMGMKRSEVEARMDAIADFAEFGPQFDAPLKTYSSGMALRLGFAIAVHSDPDIMLVDEVLAVGDEAFRVKCICEINSLRKAGKTIVIVREVESFCDRAVLLADGKAASSGKAADVAGKYRESLRA
jgi:lipopolysaccharide transport system ATP-binding protein